MVNGRVKMEKINSTVHYLNFVGGRENALAIGVWMHLFLRRQIWRSDCPILFFFLSLFPSFLLLLSRFLYFFCCYFALDVWYFSESRILLKLDSILRFHYVNYALMLDLSSHILCLSLSLTLSLSLSRCMLHALLLGFHNFHSMQFSLSVIHVIEKARKKKLCVTPGLTKSHLLFTCIRWSSLSLSFSLGMCIVLLFFFSFPTHSVCLWCPLIPSTHNAVKWVNDASFSRLI